MSGTPTFVLTWYFGPSSSAHLAVALRPPAAAVPLACTRVPRAQGSGGRVFARAHLAWALPSLEQYTRAQSSHTAPPSLEWYRSAPRVRRCPHWSSTPTHRAVALRHPHWSGTAVHRSLGAAHNARLLSGFCERRLGYIRHLRARLGQGTALAHGPLPCREPRRHQAFACPSWPWSRACWCVCALKSCTFWAASVRRASKTPGICMPISAMAQSVCASP